MNWDSVTRMPRQIVLFRMKVIFHDLCFSKKSIIMVVLDDARKESAQLLNDVSEDFQSITSVKKKFEEWKRYYNQSYQDSYVSLALPGVFEFYVRLELLQWDPLKASS